jgi:hypothetical protein
MAATADMLRRPFAPAARSYGASCRSSRSTSARSLACCRAWFLHGCATLLFIANIANLLLLLVPTGLWAALHLWTSGRRSAQMRRVPADGEAACVLASDA